MKKPKVPAILDKMTDTVLAYKPKEQPKKKKRKKRK